MRLRRHFDDRNVTRDHAEERPLIERDESLTELMLRGLDGDSRAQARLLSRSAERLRPYYRRRLSSEADVEDLVQVTLLALHSRRESFDRSRAYGPWLHAIARYKLMDHLRRHYGDRTVPLPDDADDWLSADHPEPGAAHDIAALLDTLPVNQRRWIGMTKLEGLSMSEAADTTGHTEGAVKVGVHRGLKRLAALVRKDNR